MKTIKSLIKLLKGDYLEPSDQRRIDSFLLDVKAGLFTLLALVIMVLLLIAGGAFNE